MSEQARCSWDKWEFVQNKDRVAAANRAVVEAVLTVRAPADYDGLVLGLDVTNAEQVPDDPFAENAAPADVPELWDGSAGDWVFVRASEWIESADSAKLLPVGTVELSNLAEHLLTPEPVRTQTTEQQDSTMVWIPATKTGKYHRINNCGNMNPEKASYVTIEKAKSLGYTEACDKCW